MHNAHDTIKGSHEINRHHLRFQEVEILRFYLNGSRGGRRVLALASVGRQLLDRCANLRHQLFQFYHCRLFDGGITV